MNVTGYDSETYPIERAQLAPRMVSAQFCSESEPEGWFTIRDRCCPHLENMLENDLIVGHNLAFDMAVIGPNFPNLFPLVWRAYDEGRIWDTQLAQMLIDVATGQYNAQEHTGWALAFVGPRWGAKKDEDPEGWRLRFSELDGVLPGSWPKPAVDYALVDAVVPVSIRERMIIKYGADFFRLLPHIARTAFALHLTSCHGFLSDPAATEALGAKMSAHLAGLRDALVSQGLLRVDGKGDHLNTIRAKELLWRAVLSDVSPPSWTDSGKKAVKKLEGEGRSWRTAKRDMTPAELGRWVKEVLGNRKVRPAERAELKAKAPGVPIMRGFLQLNERTAAASKIPELSIYADYSGTSRRFSRVGDLKEGYDLPLQPRYIPLRATGRTSCRKPGKKSSLKGIQAQNFGRTGGFRGCVIPRDGYVFVSADYSSMELHTLAECCLDLFGHSKLARLLNEGVDVHWHFAARLLGVATIEEAQAHPLGKAMRQQAKAANYGFPGGMGIARFRLTYHNLGLSEAEVRALREAWLDLLPEIREYFHWVSRQVDPEKELIRRFCHPVTGFVRGNVRYPQACNSPFQTLGAFMATDSHYRISRDCYTPGTDLYGCRQVIFAHDENIAEVPESRITEAALAIERHMWGASLKWTPHVPCKAPAAAMRRWRKDPPAVWLGGQLIPCEDAEEAVT